MKLKNEKNEMRRGRRGFMIKHVSRKKSQTKLMFVFMYIKSNSKLHLLTSTDMSNH